MNKSKRLWAAALLTMCLMLCNQWLIIPGYCAPDPLAQKNSSTEQSAWDTIPEQQQALILNALKSALNDPALQAEAAAFADIINTDGLGGLLQNYLQMDMTQVSDVGEALKQDFMTAIKNGDVGSGGPPYVNFSNEGGSWTPQISNGGNGAESPNTPPTLGDQGGNQERVTVSPQDGVQLDITDTDRKLSAGDAAALIGNGATAGQAVLVYDKDIQAGTTPVTLSFTVRGTASPQKLFVCHYVDGAWRLEGSGDPRTVTVTVSQY